MFSKTVLMACVCAAALLVAATPASAQVIKRKPTASVAPKTAAPAGAKKPAKRAKPRRASKGAAAGDGASKSSGFSITVADFDDDDPREKVSNE